MTIEELEQLKADGMIDDRKYQQMKAQLSMQDYQPNQNPMQGYTPSNQGYNVGADSTPYEQSEPTLYDRGGMQSVIASQEIERGNKIRELEAQIEQVKERIARNKRALTGKSYEDVNKKLASLEMGKIGLRLGRQNATPDPTMLWRWNQQRLDTAKANEQVKGTSANKFMNEAEALIKTSISPDYAEQRQDLANTRQKIAEGKTLGLDVSGLEEREKALQEKIEQTYNNVESVKTVKAKLKNLDQQLVDKTITPQQYTAGVRTLMGADFDDDALREELNTKSMLGTKKGVDAGKANKRKADLKDLGF